MNDLECKNETSQKMIFDKKIWKLEDICAFLEISKTCAYSMVNRGQIPYKKIGKRLYFNPHQVLETFRP